MSTDSCVKPYWPCRCQSLDKNYQGLLHSIKQLKTFEPTFAKRFRTRQTIAKVYWILHFRGHSIEFQFPVYFICIEWFGRLTPICFYSLLATSRSNYVSGLTYLKEVDENMAFFCLRKIWLADNPINKISSYKDWRSQQYNSLI